MFASFLSHVGIAVLAATGTSGPTHAWIADIKSRRNGLVGQEVRLEGEVMDVRSTSPTARRGFYRLTDASDPIGVLVRTEKVPIDGGSFRLRAKVAEDQIVPGTLLLDELERDRTDGRPVFPMIVVVGSSLALALLVALFRRAHAEERRYAVAPPLWLLPDAGPYGKAPAVAGPVQPAINYDSDLEEVDRQQQDRLKRRKHSLLKAMAGSLTLTGLSLAWVLSSKPASGQVPAFIFIDANDPSVPISTRQTLTAETAIAEPGAPLGGDSALRVTPDTARDRRNSTALALAPPQTRPTETRTAPRVSDPTPVRADTARRDVPVPPPAPSPSPAPQPTPPPVPPPPPPPPEPAAPVPDPEVDRARAHTRLEEAAGRLVAAINAKRTSDVALMLPESMAGDLGRRERFLKLIKDFGPKASLGVVDDATVTDDRGEARLTIAFAWRGDFGVDKKKTGRLQAVVRREGDGWRFEGARLLDAIP
jgi:hypothetical protein